MNQLGRGAVDGGLGLGQQLVDGQSVFPNGGGQTGLPDESADRLHGAVNMGPAAVGILLIAVAMPRFVVLLTVMGRVMFMLVSCAWLRSLCCVAGERVGRTFSCPCTCTVIRSGNPQLLSPLRVEMNAGQILGRHLVEEGPDRGRYRTGNPSACRRAPLAFQIQFLHLLPSMRLMRLARYRRETRCRY
jgi:hypothetical protein